MISSEQLRLKLVKKDDTDRVGETAAAISSWYRRNVPVHEEGVPVPTEVVMLDEETGIVALVRMEKEIPLAIMKPKYERKPDGHLGGVDA